MTFGLSKTQEEFLLSYYKPLLDEMKGGFISIGSVKTDIHYNRLCRIDDNRLSNSEKECLSDIKIKISTFRSVSK